MNPLNLELAVTPSLLQSFIFTSFLNESSGSFSFGESRSTDLDVLIDKHNLLFSDVELKSTDSFRFIRCVEKILLDSDRSSEG